MFNLPENVKKFHLDDDSIDVEAMQQCNLARWARGEKLEIEILRLSGQMNAVQYRFIKLLGDFDETGGWQGDGIKSFAHWLNWKIGMGMVMGREKVRVARSLPDLPLIDKAFSEGKISYTKVRAMTRVATPENEQFLLQIAEYGTADHIEYLVRKYKLCKQLQEPRDSDNWKRLKDLGWYQDETGMIVINVRLPPEEGALVIKALELIQAENRRKREEVEEVKVDSTNVSTEAFSEDMPREDFLSDRASALTHMAEHYLSGVRGDGAKESGNSLGEKYQIFLHINANAASINCKVNDSDHCSIDNKRFLTPRVAKRLACDASLTTVLEDDKGNVLNIGRRSRIVPRAMSHALRIRDGGCRYPSCTQTRHTDSHHIKHWADGGETKMDNLVTLCRFHHGLLHKGEYRIHRDESDLVFTNSRNEVITSSFYPQFPGESNAKDCLDPHIDENTAASKWRGESMDSQQALQCMFQLE
jgi:hypothetical protein